MYLLQSKPNYLIILHSKTTTTTPSTTKNEKKNPLHDFMIGLKENEQKLFLSFNLNNKLKSFLLLFFSFQENINPYLTYNKEAKKK